MRLKQFVFGMIGTNCYILYDEKLKKGIAIDIADSVPSEYFDFIDENGLEIEYMLLTHGHFDHTYSAKKFKEKYPKTKFAISKADYDNMRVHPTFPFLPTDEFIEPDLFVSDGEEIDFFGGKISVLATPGHSSGSVCYLYENLLFAGDTVFKNSIGKTSDFSGSYKQIMKSIEKIKALNNCKIYPGHMQLTDLESEKRGNPYFNGYEY